MRGRRLWLVLVVALAGGDAHASDHWFDASFGYSGAGRFSWINGFDVTLTVPIGHRPAHGAGAAAEPIRYNLVAALHRHHGPHDGGDVTQVAFSLGARYSFVGSAPRRLPFLQALLVYEARDYDDRQGSGFDTEQVGVALGAGWEHTLGTKAVSVRTGADLVLLPGADETSWYPRATVGLVFRFGAH